jgi:hypothetical protein
VIDTFEASFWLFGRKFGHLNFPKLGFNFVTQQNMTVPVFIANPQCTYTLDRTGIHLSIPVLEPYRMG